MSDQSNVTEDSGVQLTPTSTKCNAQFNSDVMKYLCGMNAMLNVKFHELKSEIHEQKIKCESNFSELKKDVYKRQGEFRSVLG